MALRHDVQIGRKLVWKEMDDNMYYPCHVYQNQVLETNRPPTSAATIRKGWLHEGQ